MNISSPITWPFAEALTDARIPSSAQIKQGGFLYRPALFAQAEVVYLARKYNLELNRQVSALPQEARGRVVNWDDFAWLPYKREELTGSPLPSCPFHLPAGMAGGCPHC